MSDQSNNVEIWKSLYAQGKNDLKYPNDVLVRLGSRMFERKNDCRILDFGFGTGANLLHFARQGFVVSGVEISEHAVEITKTRIREGNLKYDKILCINPNVKLPFDDNYFDIVIIWQVLCYNDWESALKTLRDLDRVLKAGGLFVCATTAPGDISHSNSENLGNGEYRSRVPGQEGCRLLIPEESQLPELFPSRSIDVGYLGYSFGGIEAKHWIITYRKE